MVPTYYELVVHNDLNLCLITPNSKIYFLDSLLVLWSPGYPCPLQRPTPSKRDGVQVEPHQVEVPILHGDPQEDAQEENPPVQTNHPQQKVVQKGRT